MDWLIVGYDTKTSSYVNSTYRNCSKSRAIYEFKKEYFHCMILNVIDL